MAIYISSRKLEAWKEVLHTNSISHGSNSDEIVLASTNGTYGNYFIMWQWDNRTAYRWYDAGNGTGTGYGVLRGNSGGSNYTFSSIYSNSSAVTSLDSNSCRITNSTGGGRYLACRILFWTWSNIGM